MADGYVNKNGGLQVDQSDKQQKFVGWLYNQLKSLRTNTAINTKIRNDKRSQTQTYSKSFQTKAVLQGFRHMWYKPCLIPSGNTCSPPKEIGEVQNPESLLREPRKIKYRKVLPKSLPCIFNATFLTLWFAGDGTKMHDQRGAKFEVTSLTAPERNQLKLLFKIKFDLSVQINRAGVNKNGTEQWTLCINAPEYDKFRDLITQMDLIPTLFSYKLHSAK